MAPLVVHGSGHFTIGFVLGYLFFCFIMVMKPRNYSVLVYGPLLPFGLGSFFALPYFFEMFCPWELQHYIGTAVNIFGAYGWLHHSGLLITFVGNLNKVALIDGFIYLLIVRHYISTIKKIRGEYAS